MAKVGTTGKGKQKEKTKESLGTTPAVEEDRSLLPSPQKKPSKKPKKKPDRQQDNEDGIPEEGLTAECAHDLLQKLDQMKGTSHVSLKV